MDVARAADAYSTLWLDLPHALGEVCGPPARIEPLSERVRPLGDGVAHVGLCWAASATRSGRTRSIPLLELTELQQVRGVRFHCLQVGRAAEQAPTWMTRHELADYDDTAALIGSLDAVVSVDTAVANLAATMGVPTHVVLNQLEDWKWRSGSRTPWYPSAMVCRGEVRKSIGAVSVAIRAGAARAP